MAGAAYICMRYFLFALFTVTLGQMLIAQAFKQAKADIPIVALQKNKKQIENRTEK